MEDIIFEEKTIDKDYDRLYYFLKDQKTSERHISKLRTDKNFLFVNGQNATMRTKLKKGDTIKFAISFNEKSEFQDCDLPLDIVFEDENLLIINKPASLVTTPTRSHYSENLAGAVCNYMARQTNNFTFRAINRLDKDTSGLVIIAKNLFIYNQIKNIEKEYVAICQGKIDEQVTIDKPILTQKDENGINVMKRVISPFGKIAKTIVSPIKFNDGFSLLSIKIEHGRTHQIRVHLSSIGHPLLGDSLYGEKSELISRTALVCKKISFYYPKLDKYVEFSCDLPNDFKDALQKLDI